MSVLVVQHEDDAPPGQLLGALARVGAAADVRRPYAGDALPASAEGLRALAVLGGAMDAWDASFPHLARTRALIADAAARDVPVLGLCLGGQLCALALGGTVSRRAEGVCIGWRRVGAEPGEPLAAAVAGEDARLFHWHQDEFTLPPGAAPLLAGADGFRHGSVTALQMHPEVTPEILAGWCEGEGTREQLARAGVTAAEVLGAAGEHQRHGRRLLDAWCAQALAPPAATDR